MIEKIVEVFPPSFLLNIFHLFKIFCSLFSPKLEPFGPEEIKSQARVDTTTSLEDSVGELLEFWKGNDCSLRERK